jgi:capsular exopolysaccharide synthesis family protein
MTERKDVEVLGPALALDLNGERGGDFVLDYWRLLHDRRWIVLGITGAVLAITLAITLLTTPVFRAQSTIKIERDSIKVINSEGVTPADSAFDRDYLQTQYELLRSRSLALRVIQDLGLIDLPYFAEIAGPADAKPGASGTLARQKSLVGPLLAAVTIEPIRNSLLVRINVDATDPQLAARIANAYADAFIRSNIEGRFEASSYARKYLEDRLAELKGRLEDSEKELVGFAEEEQIISLGEDKPPLSAQNLSEINVSLARAQEDRIKAEAEARQASVGSGLGLPQVVDNALIQSLRQSRAILAGQYQEKLRLYKPDYPEMQQLQGRIKELDQQIATEVGNIRSSLASRYRAASAREALLSERVGELKSDVLDLAKRSIQYNILKRETATNQQLYDALLQRYKVIGLAGGIGANNISVVDRADVPGGPYKPNLIRNLALGLMLGLLLGVLAAFGSHLLDRRVHSAKALETLTRLPALGVVPLLDAGITPAIASRDLRSPFSEAYRSVRTALQFSTAHGLTRSLLVTSAAAGEGKTTTASELARNIAQLGHTVVLVDADLRNPSLHKLFGLANAKGLSSVLAGAMAADATFQATDEANLTVVTSGPLPPNPPELLGGDGLIALLDDLAKSFDVVILDGPPVLGLADAPLLASRAEATLLVVSAEMTRKDAVQGALQRLYATRGRVIGTLLIRYQMHGHGDYGYGNYGYLTYGGKADGTSEPG